MTLSIIILNYNTFNLTCQCIESIYKETHSVVFEIILIDNASHECSPKKFKKLFPELILIENTINQGFGRANNQGMAIAKGEYILLLNSDTRIIEGAIESCYNYLNNNADKRVGVIGCRQVDENQNELITHNNKSHYSFLSEILFSFPLLAKKFDKRNINQQFETKCVSKISGSFIFLKRSFILEKIFI